MRELYVTSAFSLSMCREFPCTLEVQRIASPQEAEEMIITEEANGTTITFRIGHESTVQVLKKLFPRLRIPDKDRTPVKVPKGDGVLVFQLYKRPAEGQVFTERQKGRTEGVCSEVSRRSRLQAPDMEQRLFVQKRSP